MTASRIAAACAGLLLSASAAFAQPPPDLQSQENIRAHMGFLASDLLEGREAGTRGYDIAAEYVAAQFRQLGLAPAGDAGSYFQRVPMVAFRPANEGRLAIRRGEQVETLVFGKDYIVGRNPLAAETALTAPLVFVGYGIVAPEHRRDDYAGLDVKGKIVVALEGAPKFLQSEERAYHRNSRTKRAEAARRGAVGFISIATPAGDKVSPFARGVSVWRDWGMTWRSREGKPYVVAPEVVGVGSLSLEGAAKLFAGARTPLSKIYQAADTARGVVPRFELPGEVEVLYTTELRNIESRNVAARLEGSDPTLATETVVLSAHLDHVGLSEAKPTDKAGADRIHNGALDNASGVATTLEVARLAAEAPVRPKRSLLFLMVTAEEKGLVGAEYFARNPTVARAGIVANVNLDMPILTYDFVDVVAFGAERSTIGPVARAAAQGMGVTLSPDPLPEEGLFTRSDHYRFVEAGVPSVFLMTGFSSGGEAKFRGFLKDCYHRPCDDLSQAIDYRAGARFARINYEITRALADAQQRPAWNHGDFFGDKFSAQRQP
jgi:Zn-dependent M28 family amino/carboxypeptidase